MIIGTLEIRRELTSRKAIVEAATKRPYKARDNWVDNTRLREEVLKRCQTDEDWKDLARVCGFVSKFDNKQGKTYQSADTTWLKRRLGIKPLNKGHGSRGIQKWVEYETAVKIVLALGIDPVDVDV